VPGLEFAGEVAAVGASVTDWREGDRVFGITAGGAHAEYLCAHPGTLARIPDELDWVNAAAAPEAFITAFDALVTQGALRSGERVLVTAAGSGVGLAALQVARALHAVPYGTSRTASKLDRAREYGLEAGVTCADGAGGLPEAVREWTRGAGVDLVLDLVGGPYVPAGIEALALRGRLMLVGLVAGRTVELALGDVLARRLTIRGTVLRGRPLSEKIAVTRGFVSHVVPMLADGRLRPVIETTFPLEQVREAHALLESNSTFGKVVLVM
jgi:NADPH:quinone reductase-like Zn-dependent oxidoreductase